MNIKDASTHHPSRPHKERVAVKLMDKQIMDHQTRQLLASETAAMDRLDHPHIVRLFHVKETLANICLVMEYADGGDLAALVERRQASGGGGFRMLLLSAYPAVVCW